MSSDLPPKPTPSPVSRNRSSFLSKFRSPLGHRNRSITDYYIDLDDPWRSYFPGDVIKGTVLVTVVKPVRITHVVVCLHGYVKVFKNAVPAGEAAPDLGFLGPGRGRRGAEYMGNGLATLFEDEVVLCGDGRLKEGIYKFRFEMGLPPYALPSSINFERGTVSYSLTSTLTRPTTINPTLTCRRRVNLLENIDIAPFPAPKARIVTLEPISKRSKSKAKAKSTSSDATAAPDTSSIDTPVSGAAASVDNRPPLSPSPSNVSSSSRPSESSQSFQIHSDPSSSTSAGGRNSEGRSATPSISDKTITAKAEVLRAGVLPGDTLPIKVTINHWKQVRSAQGIIITLYRQGRIDLHPAIPVGPTANGKKPVYEDCYPRSRTGLGGLTLGTSRTSSTFRKDLSQTFAPLIVDPTTMNAVVKTSIRVPEDAFPTITRVPGAMINFRYYVEVVVDLRGKVSSPDRFIPRFNMVSGGSTFSPSGQVLNPADANGSAITANWAGNILDTDHVRREKGVISVAFEVVVGTRDSQRGQANGERSLPVGAKSEVNESHLPPSVIVNPVDGEEWPEASPMPNAHGEFGEYGEYGEYGAEDYDYGDYGFPDDTWSEYPEDYAQPFPPMGPMAAHPEVEEPVDEKTRIRQHEEGLLPSQPPGEDEAGPSNAESEVPTAPVLSDDHHLQDYEHVHSPGINGIPHAVQSAESLQTIVVNGNGAGPSEPTGPSEDKQELERQRLMYEASAPSAPPPEEPDESGEGPSAPTFNEDDQLVGGTAHADESLPRYQR
ncbi:C4-dicarboxylate transporter/malic acid transport protein [Penicillium atrosanguineum]|uniref:C4-dicarboxylate transporter/malic acid transport protein n=1 Tax=Penicillium atrosanguineum TaxID=1132637 RepID=UPI00239A7BB4|nr:C4-dicarboxylate transporter/malic acid transport protein [Penicillium atrosanguineum]KAJ5301075.1 C4-dicarboxylate transporter/malic acid transport protein [Penicillium atrosanguineum]